MKSGKNPWVSIPRPNPAAKVRLFCFPYAGGGSSVFYPWAKQLPYEIELCQVHLPGRETRLREPLISEMDLLTTSLAVALAHHLDDRPFAFFGHSMGALVVFELSRVLRRQRNMLPVHIFISGHCAPHLPDRHPPLRHMSNEDFMNSVRVYDGTPAEVFKNKELMDIFLPILRADFALIETYRYVDEKPIECPITAFGGYDDPRANKEEIEAWREQTKNHFSVHFLSGDHFFIKPHQPYLLQVIAQNLNGHEGGGRFF